VVHAGSLPQLQLGSTLTVPRELRERRGHAPGAEAGVQKAQEPKSWWSEETIVAGARGETVCGVLDQQQVRHPDAVQTPLHVHRLQ
jgi:hypothetical protein